MNNEKMNKLLYNKYFLFIIPNLICAYQLLYYYNTNLDGNGVVLFHHAILLFFILFGINSIIYLFLNKVLKNEQKVCCILSFISIFYFVQFNFLQFLIYIASILLIVFDFKKFIHCKLDYGIALISFIVIFLFSYNFISAIYNFCSVSIKSRGYDYKLNINIDENKETPNIYWIHCDGMIGLDVAKEYFNYKKTDLENYLNNNNYIVNENAKLVAGHSTQTALAALFNPYYYDNFFGDYLKELEKTFLNNNKKTSFIVNYNELSEKRLNNELFNALDSKDYTTIAIADYNQYTSFNTDFYYDYFVFHETFKHLTEKKELRYIELNDNNKFNIELYNQFNYFRGLLNTTFLYPVVDDFNSLNYKVLDYNDLDMSDYPRIENTSYWGMKAILKSVNHSLNINDNKFVFIDYKLNHLPLTYDAFGNELSENCTFNLNFYLGNYIYSSRLLIELLDYIKTHDENAIIVVQGDHGIHSLKDTEMKDSLSINQKEVQDIRNSVISAIYIPNNYKNGDETYLDNPLNISRYLINNYVGKNYDYIK